MFKRSSLWSAILIASLVAGSATSAVSAENAVIPNFASADFGWLLQGGIDFRPIPGKVPPIAFDPAVIPSGRVISVARWSACPTPRTQI